MVATWTGSIRSASATSTAENADEPFVHLLYHCVLTCSNPQSVSICPSESLEALSAELQPALWQLRAVPHGCRTDGSWP